MRKGNAHKKLLDYSFRLQYKTCDLKSKLTALVLFVEECDSLEEEQRRSILQLCEAIAAKNSELIGSESNLISALNRLFPGSKYGKEYSLLENIA